jgi:hypothetical protein
VSVGWTVARQGECSSGHIHLVSVEFNAGVLGIVASCVSAAVESDMPDSGA